MVSSFNNADISLILLYVSSEFTKLLPMFDPKQSSRAAVSVILITSLIACAGLDDFKTEVTDEATIDGTYLMNTPSSLNFGGQYGNLQLSATKDFQDQGIDPDDVDAIYITGIVIEAINPEGARLDPIIRSLDFSISAPGQAEKLIGRSIIPDGELRIIELGSPTASGCSNAQYSYEMSCAANGAQWLSSSFADMENIKDYATADSMSVTANVELKQKPLFTTTLRTTIKLLVDINLF